MRSLAASTLGSILGTYTLSALLSERWLITLLRAVFTVVGKWWFCNPISTCKNMFYPKKSSSSESWHMGRFHGPLIWKENVNKDVSDIFQVARKSWDGWVYSGRLKVGRVKIQQSFSLSSSINSNLDSRCEKYTFKIGKNCLKCSFKTWIICWWLLLINL